MATPDKSVAIVLQERDVALLLDLYESRIMTLAHLAALHFDGKREAAKKRIQRLKATGHLAERPRQPNEPSVLHVTRQAFKLLHESGKLADLPRLGWAALDKRSKVSAFTIRHELDVMSVKAALLPAIRRTSQYAAAEFSTWPRLFEFHARPPASQGRYKAEMLIKPDGFLRIHEREDNGDLSEHTFFLEVDRSTETQEKLAAKATCYINYYKNGGMAMKHGRPRSEYQSFPFRVLMVFQTAERRNNAAETLLALHPPILTQVWLTTMADLLAEPLGAVWVRPGDYREAMKDSEGQTRQTAQHGIYRRSLERDRKVEATVCKVRLIDGEQTDGTTP